MYDLPVYLLDLCIFSYHLHSQTLIWPMDPYYEQLANGKGRRRSTMTDVHTGSWLPPAHQPGPAAYRGPSSCMIWPNMDNGRLDPIVSRYDRLYPWRSSFTRPNREDESWIVYNTPVEITDPIDQVYMVRYGTGGASPWPYQKSNQPQPPIAVDQIHAQRPGLSRKAGCQQFPAADLLYCFEGGTGGTEKTHAPIWSMMGYVLAKEELVNALPVYDVCIVFRGSRSGAVRPGRAFFRKDNPDWSTDLGLARTVEEDDVISGHGSVCRGFRSSLKTILPTLMRALEEVQLARNAPPRHIYVTGHSLGGALAAQFASAMLLGNEYGPNGRGVAMPQTLRAWPWSTMRLVTFSAPSVGGQTFHTMIDRILPSLRIWLEGDPITQERWHFPAGIQYKLADSSRVMSLNSHQPYKVRERLIEDRIGTWFPKKMRNVPATYPTPIDHADVPWVRCETFLDVLNYFNNTDRLNRTTLSECLGAGGASDFASEFMIFLKILDPAQTWTLHLIAWIKSLPTNASFHPLIISANIPNQFGDTFKKYLTVCLVLCAISKGMNIVDVEKMFEGTAYWRCVFTWQEIKDFK